MLEVRISLIDPPLPSRREELHPRQLVFLGEVAFVRKRHKADLLTKSRQSSALGGTQTDWALILGAPRFPKRRQKNRHQASTGGFGSRGAGRSGSSFKG